LRSSPARDPGRTRPALRVGVILSEAPTEASGSEVVEV
jgi:hypothetical protein